MNMKNKHKTEEGFAHTVTLKKKLFFSAKKLFLLYIHTIYIYSFQC